MSDNSTNDLDLNLHFLPEWAKQGSNKNLYDKYTGNEESGRSRPPRRGDGDRKPGRGRPQGAQGGGGGGGRRPSSRGPQQGGKRPPQGGRGPSSRPPRREPEPVPDLDVAFTADEAVSNSLAEQIKITARAYPLFSIAQMILGKPERYHVKISTIKNKGTDEPAQKLFVCALDNSLWLSQSAAVDHLLSNHLNTFYETVKTEAEPPKGTYTFVAQCGMSGVVLGPPNYHDYQNQLRRVYNERFSKKMSFDRFKSRVKIVKDEEVVNKWLEDQSFVTTYKVLNSPEPLDLNSWEEVIQHFNENHVPNIIQEVSRHSISGTEAENYPCNDIRRLVRVRLAEQKRFPLKVVHLLSQQFSARGLQFFKVNKTVTHVCVSRPHYLDLDSTNVKDGIRRIIGFIQEHPGCNRKQLIDSLSTQQPADTLQQTAPSENAASETSPVNDGTVEDTPQADPSQEAAESTEASSLAAPAPAAEGSHAEPTEEQKAIISDLHWLLYQGNVIEFASGVLEVAKKPAEKKKAPAAPKPAAHPAADSQSQVQESAGSESAPSQGGEIQPAGETSSQQSTSDVADQPASQEEPLNQGSEGTIVEFPAQTVPGGTDNQPQPPVEEPPTTTDQNPQSPDDPSQGGSPANEDQARHQD
jgi:hypothetical protein